jgi:hypothetical protein
LLTTACAGVLPIPARPPALPDPLLPYASHRPRHSMDASYILEIDIATFASSGRVQDERHVGKWLGVLDRIESIVATGATTVVLPCPMLQDQGLGVQVYAPFYADETFWWSRSYIRIVPSSCQCAAITCELRTCSLFCRPLLPIISCAGRD